MVAGLTPRLGPIVPFVVDGTAALAPLNKLV